MAKTKTTKAEKTPLLTTHKATTPAPAVTRAVMLVTPALAAEWLKSNTGNRAVDKEAVDRLAGVIRRGGWRTTHQGIAIGADGALYDGQHRLHAIVAAGRSVTVVVTTGLTPDDLAAIDSNVGKGTRTPRDILRMSRGLNLTTNAAGALSFATALVAPDTSRSARRVTAEMLDESERTHGDAFRALAPILVAGTIRVGSSPVLGSLMIAWRSAPAQVVAFAEMLRTGENLPAHHPALTLRSFLFSRVGIGGNAHRTDVSRRTFAAFAAFMRGAPLQKLYAGDVASAHYIAEWHRVVGTKAT